MESIVIVIFLIVLGIVISPIIALFMLGGLRSRLEQMELGANTHSRELRTKLGRVEELLAKLVAENEEAKFISPSVPKAAPVAAPLHVEASMPHETPENAPACEEGFAPPFCADVTPPSVAPVFAKTAETPTINTPSILSIPSPPSESENTGRENDMPFFVPPLPRAADDEKREPRRILEAYKPYEPPPPSAMEIAFQQALAKVWNWIVVGQEHRIAGIPTEFAVATTWLIRAGVLCMVLAVGYGLMLSIERGIMPPEGRVALSFLGGAAFLVLGVRFMTKSMQALGQGLIGCGIAIFYFAFFASYSMYELMPSMGAFAGMIFVTIVAAFLATRFNALSIAVLGLVGGYLTPVIIKTPDPNYYALYFYLTLLAVGMALISFKRQWPLLIWLSFLFNSVIFAVAASMATEKMDAGIVREMSHLCGFFVIYSAAIIAYTTRHRVTATPLEIIALFANALFTFGYGSWLIGWDGGDRKIQLSIFAFCIAAFYAAHIWGFLMAKRFDRVVVSGFIALVAIFLGVAVPLLCTGAVLTSVFALQALVFLWLSRRLNSRMFFFGSFLFYAITLVLMLVRFMAHPFSEVTSDTYLASLADHLGDFIVPILSLFAAEWVLRRPTGDTKRGVADLSESMNSTLQGVGVLALTLFFGAAVVYMTFELSTVLRIFVSAYQFAGITVLWMFFALYLLMMRRRMPPALFKTLAGLMVVALVLQWFFGGWTGCTMPTCSPMFCLAAQYDWELAFPRLLSTVACLLVVIVMWRTFTTRDEKQPRHVFFYTALTVGFLYLTFEAATLFNAFFKPETVPWAVSVVWGIYALAMLLGGLQFNYKALRITGLVLFVTTIAKVFLFDLADSDVLYRLVAFFILGIALLLAAYAYLRKRDKFQSDSVK